LNQLGRFHAESLRMPFWVARLPQRERENSAGL
jgi:hypothetical protein